MLTYILATIIGYLVGSLPTAYLLVKLYAKEDIRSAGSGNVGAFNASRVSKSKTLGILVGVLDAVKGFVPVWLATTLYPNDFLLISLTFFGVLAGHIFPVWLKFKGGRGLASAAGGMLAVVPAYVAVWCILWFIVYKVFKGIILANVSATVLTLVAMFVVPEEWLVSVSLVYASGFDYRFLGIGMTALLLMSHSNAAQELKDALAGRSPDAGGTNAG